MKVALFVTCLVDTVSPSVGRATVTVLERLGVEVAFPAAQTCCGQMHANAGHEREARVLARRFVECFDGFETIVTPSASCAAHVRSHLGELAGDDRGVAGRVLELSQFVVDRLGVTEMGARFEGTVAYHPSCHSLRALGVGDAPHRLLRAIEGLELVSLADAEECCGFGGTFSVTSPEVSSAMLADKIAAIEASGAAAVCACDASCLLHIRGGLERRGSAVRALHLAEVLAG